MPLIDTHVHLNNTDLARDLPGVLERARTAGIGEQIVIGYDLPSSAEAVRLAETNPHLWAVVGIHPHDAAGWSEATAEMLRTWSAHPRVVAIGEIGLDFYTGTQGERVLAPAEVQATVFRAQRILAEEAQLPVVIHCREAYPETLAILTEEAGKTPVILHCFAGNEAQAQAAWERGWFLGVGGTVTYKKNTALQAIVREAPATSLLLETDAPYLSPEPLRGRYPNEPARVAHIAAFVARLRGETTEHLSAQTTENARRAFPRLAAAIPH